MYNETRFTMLRQSKPEAAAELLREAQADADARWKTYEYLSKQPATNIAAALTAVARSDSKEADSD